VEIVTRGKQRAVDVGEVNGRFHSARRPPAQEHTGASRPRPRIERYGWTGAEFAFSGADTFERTPAGWRRA
jgi:hypothetical protein